MTPYRMSVAQVAELWGCSTRHVYNLIAEGKLGHIKVGELTRIRPEDLEAYEAKQWRGPSSTPPTSDSSGEVVSITSAGGKTAGRTAYQLGRKIAAKRPAS